MRRAGILAALLALTMAAPATAGILTEPLYVNMRDSGPYRLGRYIDGQPAPAGALVTSRCGLWSPSPVKVGTTIYLYAAECSGSYPGTGWRTLVRYTSRDGGLTFSSKTIVKQFQGGEIREPLVVYDRDRFHLWYGQDRNGRLSQDLMYAMSVDGLHFTVPARKFTAGSLTAISPAFAFRNDGAWWMLIEGYSPDLKIAQPHLLRFGSTFQATYSYFAPVQTDQPTQKIDASFVCRTDVGWEGLFVAYGDPLGRERTMSFAAGNPTDPWALTSDPEQPVLSFQNGSTLMHSVENPARALSSAVLPDC